MTSVPRLGSFGDLMAGVLGDLCWCSGPPWSHQLDLAERLRCRAAPAPGRGGPPRKALETGALGPAGRRPHHAQDGRIGISGSVLFATGSDQLHPRAARSCAPLARPLATYLAQRDRC